MHPPRRTFFEKVWTDHVIADLGDGTFLLQIDRLFLHDLSGGNIMRELEQSGRRPGSPDQVFAVIDHVLDSAPGRTANQSRHKSGAALIQSARECAGRLGLSLFDVGDARQGIVHVISPELGLALPGLSVVCGDSHTCTVGGVGAMGWGIGSSEGVHVLATQTLAQKKPRTMRVNFEGAVGAGVFPKDLILYLIGQIGANGGHGSAVEFAGSVIRDMPVEGRLTICNMAIELSAKYGFVAPDEKTFTYLEGREFAPRGAEWRRAIDYWRTLPTDPDAVFDREVTVDCSNIRPQVTWGTNPEQVAAVDGSVPDPDQCRDEDARNALSAALRYNDLVPGSPLEGLPLDAAYVGSCTNARLSDLREAAAVLKGRQIAPGIQAICVPGSSAVKAAAEREGLDRIFHLAGFEWHEASCAICAHMGNDSFADLRVISTTNRNFEGRQGPRTRTHLASPATVAASAIAGRIADVRKFMP